MEAVQDLWDKRGNEEIEKYQTRCKRGGSRWSKRSRHSLVTSIMVGAENLSDGTRV